MTHRHGDGTGASQSGDKFILRFHDPGMRKSLKVRAAQNERTLNAEILFLLKKGLEADQSAGKLAGGEGAP